MARLVVHYMHEVHHPPEVQHIISININRVFSVYLILLGIFYLACVHSNLPIQADMFLKGGQEEHLFEHIFHHIGDLPT